MRSLVALAVAATLAGTAGCGRGDTETGPPDPASPESVALALFELARETDPADDRVDALFGPLGDERRRAARLDAVAELGRASDVRIVESYTLDDPTRRGFDLEATLSGGGSARYSVQVEASGEPGVIVWFSGPGVEWPERTRRDSGLSTSAPPGGRRGG